MSKTLFLVSVHGSIPVYAESEREAQDLVNDESWNDMDCFEADVTPITKSNIPDYADEIPLQAFTKEPDIRRCGQIFEEDQKT